jgi:hypothetical protein
MGAAVTAVLVFGFLALLALWAIGMGISWHRIDSLERRNRDLERQLDKATGRADDNERHARDWAALADERAMDLLEHQHRCLGELIHTDSGAVR